MKARYLFATGVIGAYSLIRNRIQSGIEHWIFKEAKPAHRTGTKKRESPATASATKAHARGRARPRARQSAKSSASS